jgi:hypothetical protein
MPRDTRAAAHKRAREKAQQERQKQKQQRRIEARERKDSGDASGGSEDPDIAGIQPGPQPRPEWLDDLDSEESDAEPAEPSQ